MHTCQSKKATQREKLRSRHNKPFCSVRGISSSIYSRKIRLSSAACSELGCELINFRTKATCSAISRSSSPCVSTFPSSFARRNVVLISSKRVRIASTCTDNTDQVNEAHKSKQNDCRNTIPCLQENMECARGCTLPCNSYVPRAPLETSCHNSHIVFREQQKSNSQMFQFSCVISP